MEKQPPSPSTNATDKDSPRKLPTSSDTAVQTSEVSNGQSTETTEHIEKTTSKDISDTANPHQKPLTPIVELIRNVKDGSINAQRCEVTGDTIHLSAKSQDRNLPIALYKSLRLPTGFKTYDSGREMFDRFRGLIQHHGMLSERQSRLVAYWAMACWFADFLPFMPALVITGPAFAADALLRILQCICRRPVLLAGISPASLRSITCNDVMPTLLIRTSQLNKAMAALLEASNQPGYFVSSGKDVWQFYGAKCIYVAGDGNPQIVGSRSIHVRTGRKTSELGRLLPTKEAVQDLQNQMLFYRLAAHDSVAASTFRVTGFVPELCAMAQVLGAPLEGEPELQKGIIELLGELNEQVRADCSCGLSAMVLRAVLWHCHQPDQQQVLVHEVAEKVNEFYREEGESLRVSNATVGHTLKNLGLYTRRLGSAGRGLSLDKVIQKRTHELSYTNEAYPNGDVLPACGYCHTMQVLENTQIV
jgi:hypothetical protein